MMTETTPTQPGNGDQTPDEDAPAAPGSGNGDQTPENPGNPDGGGNASTDV